MLTEFEVDPQYVSLKACSLDDPSWLRPDRQLFVCRAQSWLEFKTKSRRTSRIVEPRPRRSIQRITAMRDATSRLHRS